MDIKEVLDGIKDESLKAIKEEFKELLETGKKDKEDFVKRSAQEIEKALIYQAQGLLDADDVATLLRKQKKIAQIEVRNAKIQTLSRIQKITYRLLDIAIDVLVKAI